MNEVLIVDDNRPDETVQLAREIGLTTFRHPNRFLTAFQNILLRWKRSEYGLGC